MTTTVRQLLDEKGHNVITVGADDTVFDAVRKMAEENIGSLIVCEGSKVIGIITERHYARNVFLEGRALPNTRVGDVMETPVLFIGPDLTAEECMAVMTDKRVRYLPVIDEGKLIGIISIGDLVKNIISNHQFTIDQLYSLFARLGAQKYRSTQGAAGHRHFAVRRFELDDKTIGIETG